MWAARAGRHYMRDVVHDRFRHDACGELRHVLYYGPRLRGRDADNAHERVYELLDLGVELNHVVRLGVVEAFPLVVVVAVVLAGFLCLCVVRLRKRQRGSIRIRCTHDT